MSSTNLQIPDLAASQSDKTTTINENVQQLEDNITETVSIAVTADFVLTDEQQNNFVRFALTGSPGSGFTMALQARSKLLIVSNSTGQTATVEVDPDEDGADGLTVDIEDGGTAFLYSDGANVLAVGGGSTSGGGGGGSSTITTTAGRGARLSKSSDQSVASGTGGAVVTWDTEDFDDADIANLGAQNTRLTVPTGVTRVSLDAGCDWSGVSGGRRRISIRQNGTNIVADQIITEAGSSFTTVNSGILEVEAGDYFEVRVEQDSGSNVNIEAVAQTFFSLTIEEVGVPGVEVNDQTGTSYTPGINDANDYVRLTNGSAIAVTIPDEATVDYAVGTTLTFEQAGTGTVTISGDTGVTVNSRGSVFDIAGQYGVASCVKVASDTWTLTGDLS